VDVESPRTKVSKTKEAHPNVKLITEAVEAVNRNDFEALKQVMSEDVVYRIYGRGPMAGIYKGHEGFKRILEVVKGVVNIRPLVVVADDEHVFTLARLSGRRKGKVLDTENCYFYRVKDGKLVEGRNMPTDQYAFDKFWS
jgi:ketosteroid isomerase-like protein